MQLHTRVVMDVFGLKMALRYFAKEDFAWSPCCFG
jgi:hypothetical protein